MKRISALLLALVCLWAGRATFGQAAPARNGGGGGAGRAGGGRGTATQPAGPSFDQRRKALEDQLKSGNKDQIETALVTYSNWYILNEKEAENATWFARTILMGLPYADARDSPAEIGDCPLFSFKECWICL